MKNQMKLTLLVFEGYFATAPESGVPQEMIAGDDRIFGGAGEDWIEGNAGDDYIDGGTDNDAAWGEEGSDILVGGNLHGSDCLEDGEGEYTASAIRVRYERHRAAVLTQESSYQSAWKEAA